MSRNGAGGYVLPSSSFVPLTSLVPTGPNLDLEDIATALTDTVAADGQTTMIAPLIHENGVATLPSVTFAGDTTTGIFLEGAAMMGFAVSGSLIWSFSPTGGLSVPIEQQANGAQILPAGSTAQRPALSAGAWRWNSSTSELEVFDGAVWTSVSSPAEIGIRLGGTGAVITSGVKGVIGPIPYNVTLTSVELTADVSGSITVDIWANTYASYPFTSGSSITASDTPKLTSAQSMQDTALTGWTTTLNSGTVLMFNAQGTISNITALNVVLKGKKF